jgi:membrane-associated phospholipid phosphatase
MSDLGSSASEAAVHPSAVSGPPTLDRVWVHLRPADLVALTLPTLFGLGILIRSPWPDDLWIGAQLLLASAAGLASRVWATHSRRPIAQVFGNFYCIGTIGVAYSRLNPLIDQLSPATFDRDLQMIDQLLFGTQPSVWLERFANPALTELLYICYSLFFFWQLALGIHLYRRNTRDFEDYFLTVITFYMLSYCGYVMIPAIGPRFDLAHMYAGELHGVLWGDAIRESFIGIPMVRDCFPSGHTGLTLLVMLRAFHKRAFVFLAIMFPFGVLLIFSTVYCRFHYVTDLLCALPFIGGVLCVDAALRRRLPHGLRLALPVPRSLVARRSA